MSSFLSSVPPRTTSNEGESPRALGASSGIGGGVRSFYGNNSIVNKESPKNQADTYITSSPYNSIHRHQNHLRNHYQQGETGEEDEEEDAPVGPALHFSEEDEGGGGLGGTTAHKDFGFFDSLTQKWVNFEDFSEVSSLDEEPGAPGVGGNPSLRMWDESLSKIEEVTECSSAGRGFSGGEAILDPKQQRLILPLNSSNAPTINVGSINSNNSTSSIIGGRTLSHRPIIVSTPSSSVSSSPFDNKSASPPSLRRQISSNSSGNEPTAIHHPLHQHHIQQQQQPQPYPRLNRTLPSSRRSSVDESIESFPINYSKSSYNSNVLGGGGGSSASKSPFGSGKILTGGGLPSASSRGGSQVSRPTATGSYHNSPALERRRKKSVIPGNPASTPFSQRQSRSQSISNFSRDASSNLNKGKSYSSGNISLKSDYSHVQSKVKAYIKSIKDLPKKPEEFSGGPSGSNSIQAGKKSLSMSNLSTSRYFPSASSGVNGSLIYPHNTSSSNVAASNLKSFLSHANLDDMTITVNKLNAKSVDNLSSKSKFDTSRISRLLDNISDEEAMGDVIDSAGEDDEVVIDVEGILTLAFNERRDKQEAKKVLSQLQTNYDKLQRKYAEAENTIDKLRFGGVNSTAPGSISGPSLFSSSTPIPKDFLMTHNNSSGGSSVLGTPSYHHLRGSSSMSSLKLLGDGGHVRSSPTPVVPSNMPLAAPIASTPSEKKERQEASKKALVDIQDQLYGLEILSDSLDPKERESAMEDVRRSFHSILVNYDNQRGQHGKQAEDSDSEMVELLKQIGKKLYVKNSPPPPSKTVLLPPSAREKEDDLLEKVSNWKTSSATTTGISGGISPTPRLDNTSFSGNSSFAQKHHQSSPSSSKIADILYRQQNNDFDSGCCPGSERSVRSKDSAPAVTGGSSRHKLMGLDNSGGSSSLNRLLPYNNFFKKKSHPSSSLIESSSTTTSIQEDEEEGEEDEEEVTTASSTSKRQIKRVDTDLSSSEPEEESLISHHQDEEEEEGEAPKELLVQQINQDINELRSLFEDHREEMMWLVSQEKQAQQQGSSSSRRGHHPPGDIYVVDDGSHLRPPSGSSSRRSLSSLHFAAVSSSSPPVSPGGTRRAVSTAGGILKSPLHSRYHSQSQSLRRLGHIGQVRKKFDSEDTAEDLSMDDREIRRREFERRRKSKLSKRRSSRESLNAPDSPQEDGRELSGEGERRIFIPKLKIEDLWTDRTADEEERASSSASSSNPATSQILSKATAAAAAALASSKDGKKKSNMEIKELLRSLEHASKMATKLKERSEEMLTVLKSEIAHPGQMPLPSSASTGIEAAATAAAYTEEIL